MVIIILVEGWVFIDLATNITIIIVPCILFYELNKKLLNILYNTAYREEFKTQNYLCIFNLT